jgi:hypothetical protein
LALWLPGYVSSIQSLSNHLLSTLARKQIVIYTTVYNTTAMQYVLPFALQGVIPIFLVMTVPVSKRRLAEDPEY